MNRPFRQGDPDVTRVGTFCLIVGFCAGLGLAVMALASSAKTGETRIS